MKNKRLKVFVSALLAGVLIGIGGTVFLSVEDKLVGAILFAVGLFVICTFGFNLFTGKVCYALDNDEDYLFNLSFIWFGNIVGTYLLSFVEHFTRIYPTLNKKALTLVNTKLSDNLLSIFLLGVLCNILIYIAVEEYKSNKHELGKYLGILFGVVVFIVCGFEHCVANMYYISIADAWSLKALLYVFVNTFGNACGGILINELKKKVASN